MIAAIAANGVIGRDNSLPWRVVDDMRFFAEITRGRVVITGRLNYDAMGRALPERHNIVLSRNPSFLPVDAVVVPTIEAAFIAAENYGETEAFVIGGAQIYRLALPYAHCFYRTRLLSAVAGDVVFPALDESEWQSTRLQDGEANERNESAFVIERLSRRRPARGYR